MEDHQAVVRTAESAEDVARCFGVMHELRPHLDEEAFAAQVRQQREHDAYRLVYLKQGDEVVAVAGYRVTELLAWGKTLYVDDLATGSTRRGSGYGSRLFDWLLDEARRQGCAELHLDSGVHRFDAHRFYLQKGMDITSHHFAIKLDG